MSKIRMVVCNGVSQVMFATACLESRQETGVENHLWVYSVDPSVEREENTYGMASQVFDWKSIKYTRINPNLAIPFRINDELGFFVNEIWMCMPSNPVEKSLQQRFKTAKLVFYEDGLHAYNENYGWKQLTCNPRRFAKWMLIRFRQFLSGFKSKNKGGFPARRLDQAYLILGDRLKLASIYRPKKRQSFIPIGNLKAVAKRIAQIQGFCPPRIDQPEKTIVFLGCIFAECDLTTWEEELAVYCKVVKRVLDLGYNVLWKEHPRAQRPFGNRLRQEFGGRLFTKKMNKLIPAEVFFTENKMAACISPHSTSLLLLSKFEIPVFQLTDFCDEFYNEAYRPVVGLVRKHVPPLQQLKPFRLKA